MLLKALAELNMRHFVVTSLNFLSRRYVDGVFNKELTTFGTGDMGVISSAWDTWESPYYLELFGDTRVLSFDAAITI